MITTSIIAIVLVMTFMFLFITSMFTRDRIVASLYLWHVGKATGAKEQAEHGCAHSFRLLHGLQTHAGIYKFMRSCSAHFLCGKALSDML